ncbi:transposase [Microbulbifer sp. TRSA007]|uniref:transposase n=1 Tax=Microbulbifer sp. TRSA007 TaxID=3243384 RepID=UPI00403989B2
MFPVVKGSILRRIFSIGENFICGRQPYPLSVMHRIHCMQLFYNLSDPAMEGALYEIESMRILLDWL